jgi:hypothetical protein
MTAASMLVHTQEDGDDMKLPWQLVAAMINLLVAGPWAKSYMLVDPT